MVDPLALVYGFLLMFYPYPGTDEVKSINQLIIMAGPNS